VCFVDIPRDVSGRYSDVHFVNGGSFCSQARLQSVSVVYMPGVWLIFVSVGFCGCVAGSVFGQLLYVKFCCLQNRVFPGSPSVVISVLCHGQWLSGT